MKVFNTIIVMTVMVVVITSLAIPVIDDMVEKSSYDVTTYSNEEEGHFRLSKIAATDSFTIAYSAAGTLTINSVDYDITNPTTYYNIVYMSDNIALRVSPAGALTVTSIAAETPFNASVTSFSMVVSAGNITYSIDDQAAVQTTYTAGYILDPKGDYFNASPAKPVYVNDLTQFSGFRYASNTMYMMMNGAGSANGSEFTFTINSQIVPDTDDQVMIVNSVNYGGSAGINAWIVPLTVDSKIPTDSFYPMLINLIPLLMILSVVMLAVRLIATRRN